MNLLYTPLRLALVVALGAASFGLAAQPPADATTSDAATSETQVSQDAMDERNCLRYTGTHIRADGQHGTSEAPVDAEGKPICINAPGSVYTREDIDSTGHITLKEALRALDPRLR
jgi:hypothetical protein